MAHVNDRPPEADSERIRAAAARPGRASIRAVVSRRTPLNYVSANSAAISPPLLPDPTGGIGVPLMLRALKRAECGFDLVPAPLILKRLPNGRCDEGATPAPANA